MTAPLAPIASFIAASQIHAVVLAGGEGRRMGGLDKGLLLFDAQPLAQRAAQRIAPFVGRVSINANRHLEQYLALGYEVFEDGLSQQQGPLGGVCQALRQSTLPYVLVLPCDVPFFPADLTHRLAESLSQHPSANVAMVRTWQAQGVAPQTMHVNPVFMLIRTQIVNHLEAFFQQGGRKLVTWAGLAGLVVVDFDEPGHLQAFMDADNREQLDVLAAISGNGGKK